METFMISNLSEEKPRYTTITYKKDDTKIIIENFIGYKITIEKIKGEEYGKKKTSKKESR